MGKFTDRMLEESMEKGKVGIVVVNYNGEKFQNECLESIYNMKYKNIEVILVDNGSTDNSIRLAREKFKDVTIIENNDNLGVAAGNNIGIKYALDNNAEYILLANNDTILEENTLSNLVKVANENIIVAPKIYYYKPNDLIWYAGGQINWNLATANHFGIKEKDSQEYNTEKYVDYSPTCCLLIHRRIFEKIGLMDERYFMYCDDTDFCARCIKNGIKILYYPKSYLWHKVSSSTGGEESPLYTYYSNRNRLYFIDKFYNKKLKIKAIFYLSRILGLSKSIIKNKPLSRKMLFQALEDYKNNKMGKQSS